jgi:hypothetical protein
MAIRDTLAGVKGRAIEIIKESDQKAVPILIKFNLIHGIQST